MIICLKVISKKCFSFIVNVNTSLKLLWALGGLSEGNQALGHSESTWALRGHSEGTQRTFRHLRHSGTWVLSRGVATGGGGRGPCIPPPPHLLHFNFWTKQGPKIRDIAFYGCSEIIRTRNLAIFIVCATSFRRFMAAFRFF